MLLQAACAPDGEHALGDGTSGVWTRRQALAVLSAGEVAARVRSGRWQVLWPGVYADGGVVPSLAQRAVAAVLAGGPGSTVMGRLAARLHGLPLVDDEDPATDRWEHRHDDVAVRGAGPALACGGRTLHRLQPRLAVGDVSVARGIPVTTPLRTLVDARLLLRPDALGCAMDAALHRGLVTQGALEDAVQRLKGWRGGPAFRQAVARADGRAESPGETLTRLLLLPALPGLVPQVEVLDEAVRVVARLDLADEALRLAVEFDGKAGHAGARMVAHDRARDRRTRRLGWTTERVTWSDVRRRPVVTRARIVAQAAELRD